MDGLRTPPITLEEAQARLLAMAEPLPVEHVDVEGALGRYLAEPLHARRTQPESALSAMDGYAVGASDLQGPWRVIGESAAGHPYTGPIALGEAIRISTGAVVPGDAGAVILQEDVARDGAALALRDDPPHPHDKHIRTRGMDFTQASAVMPAGMRIGAAQAALALAAGHKHLPVRRMPKVVIIDSGDELAPDPECCGRHQVPASNGTMLQALARSASVEARHLGPIADDIDAITSVLEASSDADLIITSGGASVGDHDLIRPALERWGARIEFWRVAIKPGKPILVAVRELGGRGSEGRRQIVLGLPGNPVSSYVTGFLFLLPLLRAMIGAANPLPLRIATRLGAPLSGGGRRREFLRATWDGRRAVAEGLQDSGALSPLARANALIDRSAQAEPAAVDDEVEIYLLENGGVG